MKNLTRFIQLSLLLVSLVFISACSMSPKYNLDFPAPALDAEISDVFPVDIEEVEGEVHQVSFGGILVQYGEIGSIYSSRSESTEEAISFFQNHLLKDFKDLPNNFSGNINGQYYATAHSDHECLFGWVNENYCFVLKASSEKNLEQLIDAFNYISQ